MAAKATQTVDEQEGFSAQERAAMKERAGEVRKRGPKVDPEQALLEKIAELPQDERVIAQRVHAIVKEAAPGLSPKLWYGMPSYARDGKVVLFFQAASKFETRYSTLGFNDLANLDDGTMWPTAYAITRLTEANEKQVADLVRRAVG